MIFSTSGFVSTLLFIASAAAHGGVGKYTWSGVDYIGYQPYNGGTQQTIQRPYSSFDPIYTPTGTNIRCNNNGQSAPLHGTIAAGTSVTATWTQWTHAEGPVTVYLAKCPGSTCSGFDGSGKVWFKIDEAGLLSGTVNKGSWGLGVVLNTLKWTTTLPADLPAGAYLMRHELLALHQANTPQFYPECAQIIVTGGGSNAPTSDYLVSLPGAFSMSDPGVTIDIYSSTATTYQIPGPKVWRGASGGASSSSAPAAPSSTLATSTRSSTSSATAPTSSSGTVGKWGQCGGTGYTGPTTCVDSTCTKVNDYYYQCL